MKLRKSYSERGASMGRPSFMPLITGQELTMKVWELELDSGGYDQGGAYWGLRKPGEKVFFAESWESVLLTQYCRPDRGTVEMTCDARDLHEAWDKFQTALPGAKISRVKWVSRCDKKLLMRLYNSGHITTSGNGKQSAAWGRSWPYVKPHCADVDVVFKECFGGYAHMFRVHKISDVGEPTYVVEELLYAKPKTPKKKAT